MTTKAATKKFGLSEKELFQTKPIIFKEGGFFGRCFGWILIVICTGSFISGPVFLALPPLLFPSFPRVALGVLILDILLLLWPAKPWPAFRKCFQSWYDIFQIRTNLHPEASTYNLPKDYLSIAAMHPHGIIPLQGFFWAGICDQFFPHMYGFGATTDIAMRLPLLRSILKWLSSDSASKPTILHHMENLGQNLYILPGGVAEIFLSRRKQHIMSERKIIDDDKDKKTETDMNKKTKEPFVQVIKGRRHGLMKLALQTGALIIPVYVFGGNDFFHQLGTAFDQENDETENEKTNTSITKKIGEILARLSRYLQGGITFYWGQYYIPFLIPYTPKCSMVMGDPIVPVPGTEGEEKTTCGTKQTCRKVSNPTQEQIQELMDRYVQAMENLFDQYKEQAGYGDDILKVI